MYPYQNQMMPNSNYFNNYQVPQYQPQPAGVAGKIVADFNEITIKDIPTDGSWAYFIKADGSEIQARRWSETGQVVPATFTRGENTQKADPVNERFQAIEERLAKIEKGEQKNE